MKQLEAFKKADSLWIRKRKGFRVHCRELVDGVRQSVLMPSEDALMMESDVAGWRLAVRLSQAAGEADDGQPVYTDVYLVDDLGERVEYYVTGVATVFNPETSD